MREHGKSIVTGSKERREKLGVGLKLEKRGLTDEPLLNSLCFSKGRSL